MPVEIVTIIARAARASGWAALVSVLAGCQTLRSAAADGLEVAVTESVVYTTPHANNGAGPLWDFNATNIARIDDTVWVSGLNTVAGLPPLNNTECNLWKKAADAPWEKVLTLPGLTREPCPMGVLQGQRLLISTNATLNPPGKPGGGPARPGLWEAAPAAGFDAPAITQPGWRPQAGPFSEHSYRSLAVDGPRGEVFVMQNVGNSHAEWAFRDGHGTWPAQGRLDWPVKTINGHAMPLRVCYVVALVKDRAVHLLGVSDVVEPNEAWREYKRQLTGKSWDYVFRNLYYAWTPDITREPFRPWLEVASREATAGRIIPGDLHQGPDGTVHAVWEDIALDDQLRERFFAQQKQRKGIGYAAIHSGAVTQRADLMVAVPGQAGLVAHWPRWHVAHDGAKYLLVYVDRQGAGGKKLSENQLAAFKNGAIQSIFPIPLTTPLNLYMTATLRTGHNRSDVLDLLGSAPGEGDTLRHVSIRISSAQSGK